MTDKELQKLMDRTVSHLCTHLRLYKKLEEEYERRWKANPSDVNDDFFIDCFAQNGIYTTVAEVEENALLNLTYNNHDNH